MIIGIDVDDVVRDICTPTCSWWYSVSGIKKTPEDIKDWDIHKWLGAENKELFYEQWFNQVQVFLYADPVEGALEALARLRNIGFNLVFVSTQFTTKVKQWTVEWLDWHVQSYDGLVFTGKKCLVKTDILIDDGPHNFESYRGLAILFDRPWNRHVRAIEYRRHHWVALCLSRLLHKPLRTYGWIDILE